MQLNQFELALKDINESIVIEPENQWAYRNKGIYYLGMGDYSNAERLLRQAIQMDGSLSMAHFHLAQVYLKKGDADSACEEFGKAVECGDEGAEKAYRQNCQ